MESAREAQNPTILHEILVQAGSTSLTALATILAHADPQQSLRTLLDLAIESAGAERGFLLRPSPQNSGQCLMARDLDREELRNPLDKVLVPLIHRAMEHNSQWSCMDVPALPDRDRWDRERLPRTTAVFLLPIDRETWLYLDHRFQSLKETAAEDPWLAMALLGIQSLLLRSSVAVDSSTAAGNTTPRPTAKNSSGPSEATFEPVSIIGEHPDMLAMHQLVQRVAPSTAPILITGESGTGKELAARLIHQQSQRPAGPFISENCGAIAENLLETELFGCMKGAFTGATLDRPGLFELAHGGTIFLDEIGDTSAGLQKKLLRVIQEGVIRRVGGQETIQIDVRVLSATNRDLFTEVKNGRFREDLYYRLNVINVHLPPLRERRTDVSLIAKHFLAGLNQETGTRKQLSPEFIEVLVQHDWPGNIRELQNEIRRAHALGGDQLDIRDLSPRVSADDAAIRTDSASAVGLDRVRSCGSLKDAIEQLEAEWISEALDRCNGRRGQVCEWLGIPKTTLYAKMRRYGLTGE
ncbi:MAG: sigma-54 dependent transcriptional regulator [Planctomycetota bacterium]|nr:sigma-54 dependent transcriptional regulator [Planctomycetota bacterium]